MMMMMMMNMIKKTHKDENGFWAFSYTKYFRIFWVFSTIEY